MTDEKARVGARMVHLPGGRYPLASPEWTVTHVKRPSPSDPHCPLPAHEHKGGFEYCGKQTLGLTRKMG
jgi:hypothetical protein